MSIELTDITSGYNLSKINDNFQTLEDYINQKLLARAETSVAGEAMMERDLDMDGHRILNADIDGSTITNDRAVRVSDGYIPAIPQSLEDRKGKVVTFDINTGNPIALAPASGSAVDVLNQLAGPNGATLVGYNSVNVKSKLDQTISVKDFGAKGDWNSTSQTGTDDTAAIQAAINALGNTYRNGGYRILYFPRGNYKITSLTIPGSLDFGVMFIGDGKFDSIIWADATNASPAIDSQIDFVHFESMGLFGALSQTTNPALWKQVFYKGKKSTLAPDVDVTFSQCAIGHAVDFIQAYGRGVVVDNTCTAFFATYLVNIVADPSIVFAGGDTNAAETGMRNYFISPQRCDVVSRLFRVTGTGACKDFINDISIHNVDALSMDRIGEFTDATITGLVVTGMTCRNSFSGALVVGKRLIDSVLNVYTAKQYNRSVTSTNRQVGLVQLTASAERVRVTGNYRELSNYAVQVGSVSTDVTIDIDVFSLGQNGSDFTAFIGANCNGLNINICTSGVAPTGVCKFFTEGTQTAPTFRCYSSYNAFVRPAVVFTPTLFVGGTAQTATTARGEANMVNGEQYQRIFWAGTSLSSSSAEVSLTLSGTPLPDVSGISSLTGCIIIGNTSYTQGLTARLDVTTNRIVFFKPSGARLLGSDLPTTFTISVDARIRTQQVLL